MSEERAAYLGKLPRAKLKPETLRQIEDAYNQILSGTGSGEIHIEIIKGGTEREKQRVSVEYPLQQSEP